MLKNPIFRLIFLKPLSLLWAFVYAVRRSMYEYGVLKKVYFKVPIISVGNLTFGGTGKTPLIIWLIKQFEAIDLDTAVLTRGYKGKLENSTGIIQGGQKFLSNPEEFGDEPLLISKKMNRGAVIVGKRRAKNLDKYFDEIKPDVVLLDDGFQHVQLYRSFNIVIFDALLPMSSYATAPVGYLREGLSALKHADFVLISRAREASSKQMSSLESFLSKHLPPETSVGKFSYKPSTLIDGYDKECMKLEDLKGKKVIALTAIASPESFYQLLANYGAELVGKYAFTDHHFFTYQDILRVLKVCEEKDAIIVTSEKDMVKIKKITKDPKIICISIEIDFLTGESELLAQVKNVLNLDYN